MHDGKLKKNDDKISNYSFVSFNKVIKEFDNEKDAVYNYEFSPIEQLKKEDVERHEKIVNYIAQNSREKGFNILPIVREHKGFKERDYQEKEKRINEEIERRFLLVKEQGYQSGYQEGVEAGKKEVFDTTRRSTEEKLETLTNMINETLTTQEDLITNQKKQIYYLLKNLTKWIILRELKDDGEYLVRLLEKLLVEMHARKNLFIKVNKNDFEKMPDILETIEKKLGTLENVRMEVDYDTSANGIVLECDNGIINGTLDEQFTSLNRLFESVGLDEKFDAEIEGDSSDDENK